MQLAPSCASQGKGWTWAWLHSGFEFCGLMERPCYLDCWSSWEITQTTKWMQDSQFYSAHSNVPDEGVLLPPASTSRLSTFLLWVSLSLGDYPSRMSFSGTSLAYPSSPIFVLHLWASPEFLECLSDIRVTTTHERDWMLEYPMDSSRNGLR